MQNVNWCSSETPNVNNILGLYLGGPGFEGGLLSCFEVYYGLFQYIQVNRPLELHHPQSSWELG
jgi:hypothetical protein